MVSLTILVTGCIILDTSAFQSAYLSVNGHTAKAKHLILCSLTLRLKCIITLSPTIHELSDISLLLLGDQKHVHPFL